MNKKRTTKRFLLAIIAIVLLCILLYPHRKTGFVDDINELDYSLLSCVKGLPTKGKIFYKYVNIPYINTIVLYGHLQKDKIDHFIEENSFKIGKRYILPYGDNIDDFIRKKKIKTYPGMITETKPVIVEVPEELGVKGNVLSFEGELIMLSLPDKSRYDLNMVICKDTGEFRCYIGNKSVARQ